MKGWEKKKNIFQKENIESRQKKIGGEGKSQK